MDIEEYMYHLRPPSGDSGYEHANLFNYGSPHLRKTSTPGYHLLKPVGGFTISDGTYAIEWEDPEVQHKV